MPKQEGLSPAQLKILEVVARGGRKRWWIAMEVVQELGKGTGPGIGCAMKGLVKRGLLRYRPMDRKEGRRQASYQIVDAGLAALSDRKDS
jgi:hypothetical protein